MKFHEAFPASHPPRMVPIGADPPPLPQVPEVVHLYGCHNCRDQGCTLEAREPHKGSSGDYATACPRCDYGKDWANMQKKQIVDAVTKHQRRERNRLLAYGEPDAE